MMSSNLSLVTSFKELVELNKIASEPCLEDFLRFVASQEECRQKWFESLRENRMLKSQTDQLNKEINNLGNKLATARKLLDQEKTRRIAAEDDKIKTETQLQMVRDLLFADNINVRSHIPDETKEKLKFLNSTIKGRFSNDYNIDRMSAIRELDSTGSILSELSFSRSEDDLDLDSQVGNRRSNKKHRAAFTYEGTTSAKRRRSSHILEVKGSPERLVAKTTVTMESDGFVSAHSEIENIPSQLNLQPSAPPEPPRCGSMESVESGLSIENLVGYSEVIPRDVGVLPISSSKINQRPHTFVSKTVIRPEECDVCAKKIKFGNTVLRCQDCRASCHPYCKEQLPLPCIAPGSTPITKNNMGVVGDYAPINPPMVPALVVHCINEVESRGLTEPGIYRVPGSDKEVKALKERFIKMRGAPRMSDMDIHVVCGCLKNFLRSLREPLVTNTLWWQFARAAEIRDQEERRAKLYQAISQLPQPNRDTLAFVILHLLRVAEAQESNKMSISNLATVLGPTVIGNSSSELSLKNDAYVQAAKSKLVLEQLMTSPPSEYWARLLSVSTMVYTPRTPQPPRSVRTPSTRSIKKLFDTPSHRI